MKKINLSPSALRQAASCLRILSHPLRLQIIQLLLEDRLSVGEIAKKCKIAHNHASTHLKLLERCSFLESRRENKNVFYSVSETHLADLMQCMQNRFSKIKG